jgi:outer membrane immunogenic protein
MGVPLSSVLSLAIIRGDFRHRDYAGVGDWSAGVLSELGAVMKIKTIVAIAALLAVPESSAFAQFLPVTVTGANSASADGWLAGAQLGYNWQNQSFVYGLEGDVSLMHLNSAMTTMLPSPPPFFPTTIATTNASMNWYGTFRGRLGWAAGPVLFYGTGGVAYGNVELNSNVTSGLSSLSAQAWSARAGYVAGGGIEYMARPDVIFSVNYQYVDFGRVSLASSTSGFGTPISETASTRMRFQAVTAGVSWLFPPGDKGPHGAWEGMYVGGHAGGDWGDRTNASYAATPAIALSDARLKRDITLVGRLDDGLGLYSYRYLWSDTVYVGVMAQEVALIRPDAVVRGALDDYLRVDYSRLGLTLMTLPEWDARGKGERL